MLNIKLEFVYIIKLRIKPYVYVLYVWKHINITFFTDPTVNFNIVSIGTHFDSK